MPQRSILPAPLAGLVLLALLTGCGGETTEPPPDTTRNLAKAAGDQQSAPAGTAVATPPAVRVTNGAGAGVAGVQITFAVVSGGGSVAGGTQTTDASGAAAAGGWTLGQAAGPNTLTASISGGTGTVTFEATATSGTPTQMTKTAGDAQSANARAAVAVAPSVRVEDQFGNPVSNATVVFAVTAGGGSATGATQTTGANGVATVGGWTLGPLAGANTLSATVQGTAVSAQFTATAEEVVIQPAQDTTLAGGTLQVTRFTVPAGRTVTVQADLIINADAAVEIAGTLQGACVALEINGESTVEVTGSIDNSCATATGTEPNLRIVAKGGYTLDGGTITTSGDGEVTNDPTLTDADFPAAGTAPSFIRTKPANLATHSPCHVANKAFVARPVRAAVGSNGKTAGDGRDGRTWTLQCRGADLQLGTNVRVFGQNGGHGGVGADLNADPGNATGGDGGKGGKLKVRSTGKVVVTGVGVLFESGAGGDGGDAVATGDPNKTGPVAASATAKGGDGGEPGLVEVRGNQGIEIIGTLEITVGDAGRGGDADATGANGVQGRTTAGAQEQSGGNADAEGGAGAGTPDLKLFATGNVVGVATVSGGDAGRGGHATAIAGNGAVGTQMRPNGGHGGNIRAVGAAGGNAELSGLGPAGPFGRGGDGGNATFRGGNGGDGWDDCGDPIVAGGKGGDGGDATGTRGMHGTGAPDGADGTGTIDMVGNGGEGGDGDPEGDGGAAGTNGVGGAPVINDPSFQPGDKGTKCGAAALIALSLSEMSVTHIVFESPCPQVIGTVRVTNISDEAVILTQTVLGTVVVTIQGGNVTLQPGQFVDLVVSFNCAQAFSFTGQIRITATPVQSLRSPGAGPQAAPPQEAFVSVTGIVRIRAVRLDQPTGPFAAGTVIQRNRVTNWLFNPAHVPNCAVDHLHSTSASGILIDGLGPFADPASTACGYGEVILVTLPPAGGAGTR